MIRKILYALVITTILPFYTKADWVPTDKSSAHNTPPEFTLLSDNSNSSVIKIDISGFDLKDFISKDKTYQTIDLITEMFTSEPGSPELPYIAKILAIPDQAGVSVEVLETGEVQTFDNINLPPARISWIEGETEPSYKENSEVYGSADIYPQEYVKVEKPSIFRNFRIARISVFPIRYIPANKELQVISSITIRVNYGKGEVINPKTSPKKAIPPSFGELYRSFIFNYQNVLDKNFDGKEEGHEVMLCIMPDEFTESFQVYADWNRESGTDVHVTKFSDIGANSNNPTIIKDHISDAYFNWEIPPSYVLIVGDDGVFPKKIVNYDYSFPNEDYFVEIEGDDYFPEMMIGRFTNQGDYRMQVMINKYMMYEKTPYTGETHWFKQGICCSNNAYESQVTTKRFTANLMMENGNFISVDTLMSDGWGSGCSMNTSDVVNALNDGRSYLNYRGEGWSSGWWAQCYDINTSTVSALNNGEKFTFVTSIGCGVAMFNTSGGNCFGEEWIQLGTLESPRGGIAFIGPTSNTHTTYNNKIDKGIYTGMFQEGMDTPGQAMMRGKLYMYNVFGDQYWVEYHYRVYCILGDPSLHIWKDIPLAVNVDHPTSVMVGNNTVEFTIAFEDTGQPVSEAELCLTGEEVFVTGVSNMFGKVYIEFTSDLEETLTVTVRGGNVYPNQSNMDVLQPLEYIAPESDPIITDLDGNLDGIINPNENCNITYTLKNWGTLDSENIEATLTTSDPDYIDIITTNPVSFGNLTPGSSLTGDPFQFYVKPDCPIGQIISFQLQVTSSTNSWEYEYSAEVLGCRLDIHRFIIQDEDSPNSNYRMDPGETVKVVFSIENIGEDIAPDVLAVLSCNDQFITIVDSTGSFGSIDTNDILKNLEDYFRVSIDPSCPAEYMAEYSLKLYTQNGNYPYEIIPLVNIPVGIPIPTDYSGPDDFGYYAYSSDDAFYEQTPVYDWFEIGTLGTEINVPNISDYTETVYLPFTFKYYDIDYTVVRISSDGWIAFGGGNQTAPINTTLPNNDNISNMVAVFWDDLYDTEILEGKILHYYDEPNHRFIIEWDSVSHNMNSAEPKREFFQAILLDPAYHTTESGNGELIFQYKKTVDTESNTIGIENDTQDIGLQYVFDNSYDQTATVQQNEWAIKFTTEPPFVYILTGNEDQYIDNKINPGSFVLEQNKPNPFNSTTLINYSLPKQSNVNLSIYNNSGELIRTLQSGQQKAGKYSVSWNGLNNVHTKVSPGIYFYRLQTEDFVKTMKLLLIK